MDVKMKKIFYFFGIILLINACFVNAEWSLPTERLIDWSNAGIPGGIPSRTTICTTIDSATYGDGHTDATSALQTAINN